MSRSDVFLSFTVRLKLRTLHHSELHSLHTDCHPLRCLWNDFLGFSIPHDLQTFVGLGFRPRFFTRCLQKLHTAIII